MNVKPLYFIAIIPPDPLRSHLSFLKKEFAANFHSYHALKSPPHITLIPPIRIGKIEIKPFIKKLETFGKSTPPFHIQLDGMGSFRTNVLFLNAMENEQLHQCHKNLSILLNGFSGINISIDKPFHPHITLANRDLSPQMFQKAWELNKSISHRYDFDANYISLLQHNGKSWDIYDEFPLQQSELPA